MAEKLSELLCVRLPYSTMSKLRALAGESNQSVVVRKLIERAAKSKASERRAGDKSASSSSK
jgi:hypothetical protein